MSPINAFDGGAVDARAAMLLLPLIDHAIGDEADDGAANVRLPIAIRRHGGRLHVSVRHGGVAFGQARARVILASVQELLHALYGDEATLALERGTDGHTEAVIAPPFEYETA